MDPSTGFHYILKPQRAAGRLLNREVLNLVQDCSHSLPQMMPDRSYVVAPTAFALLASEVDNGNS